MGRVSGTDHSCHIVIEPILDVLFPFLIDRSTHAYVFIFVNKNFPRPQEITYAITISLQWIRADDVGIPPHPLADLDLIEQGITYAEHIGLDPVGFVILITHAQTFPDPVNVDDEIIFVAYVLNPRTLTGTWWTVHEIHLLTESVKAIVYPVVTSEVNEHDVVRIETDAVIIHVLLCQFDLVMTDAVILPRDRFATALAYDLTRCIQPVKFDLFDERFPLP